MSGSSYWRLDGRVIRCRLVAAKNRALGSCDREGEKPVASETAGGEGGGSVQQQSRHYWHCDGTTTTREFMSYEGRVK